VVLKPRDISEKIDLQMMHCFTVKSCTKYFFNLPHAIPPTLKSAYHCHPECVKQSLMYRSPISHPEAKE